MTNKSEKYGIYYGELVEFDYTTGMIFSDWGERYTSMFCEQLDECGVTEILFDIEKDVPTRSLYFETTEKTNYKKLMLEVFSKHPSEFSEETNNHFRMWVE